MPRRYRIAEKCFPQSPLEIIVKRDIRLYLTLIVAGLAGNYFKFPLFLNIEPLAKRPLARCRTAGLA